MISDSNPLERANEIYFRNKSFWFSRKGQFMYTWRFVYSWLFSVRKWLYSVRKWPYSVRKWPYFVLCMNLIYYINVLIIFDAYNHIIIAFFVFTKCAIAICILRCYHNWSIFSYIIIYIVISIFAKTQRFHSTLFGPKLIIGKTHTSPVLLKKTINLVIKIKQIIRNFLSSKSKLSKLYIL